MHAIISSGSVARNVRGVVMAGGRSERMRATNGPQHKALVKVDGISLVERNIRSLFSCGILDVVVVISADETALAKHVQEHGAALADQFDGRVKLFVEVGPLGNIGVVGELRDGDSDLVVLYVDNVTSLNPMGLVTRHRQSRAALTIATHVYGLRNPFGELEVEGGCVTSYREKPTYNVRISSGSCVVSPALQACIPRSQPLGASELCAIALQRGLRVAAYEHDELWIDVNDAMALREADAIVRSAPERFA